MFKLRFEEIISGGGSVCSYAITYSHLHPHVHSHHKRLNAGVLNTVPQFSKYTWRGTPRGPGGCGLTEKDLYIVHSTGHLRTEDPRCVNHTEAIVTGTSCSTVLCTVLVHLTTSCKQGGMFKGHAYSITDSQWF